MKLTVDITNPELDALEDVLTVWSLCAAHRASSPRMSQPRLAAVQYSCPDCHRLLQTRVDKSLKLWSKLVNAYDRDG